MNLRFLETFVWVARLQSFTQAASRLHTTQAAVSQRILTLEDLLGVRLFTRVNRNVEMTPAGRRVFEQAETIVQLYESMREVGQITKSKRDLYLAFAEVAAMTFMPEICRSLSDELNGIAVHAEVELSSRINEMLRDEQIDYAFSHLEASESAIVSVPLCDYELRWMASPAIAIPQGVLSYRQIAEFPVITHPKHSLLHQIVADRLRPFKTAALRIQMSSGASAMLRLAVEAGGICLMAPAMAQRELQEGALRIIDVEGTPPSARIYLSYLEKSPKSLSMMVVRICQQAIANFSHASADGYFRGLAPGSIHGVEV